MALARSLRSMIVSILIFMGASLKELGDQNKLALCLLPPFALQYGILSFFPKQKSLGTQRRADDSPTEPERIEYTKP